MANLRIQILILTLLFSLFSNAASASLACAKAHDQSLTSLQQEALDNLQNFIQTMPRMGERPPHELDMVEGKGILKVGLLINSEKKFSALLLRALKLGAISKIDGGTVVGPKVLLLLSQVHNLSPTPVLVKGTLISDYVFQALENDIRGTKQWEAGQASRPDFPWSASEVQSLHQALIDLKIKEACLQLWGTSRLKNCGRMNFQFLTTDPHSLQWSRPASQ